MNPEDMYISLTNNTVAQDEPMPETKPEDRAPAERILDPEYRKGLRKSAESIAPTNAAPVEQPDVVGMAKDCLSLLDLVEALEGQLVNVEGELHQLAQEVLGE